MKWAGFKKKRKNVIGDPWQELRQDTFVNRRNVTKADIAFYLSDYNHLVLNQDTIISKLKTVIEKLIEEKNSLIDEIVQYKSSTISAQSSVIDLQKELLACKDNLLKSYQSGARDEIKPTVNKPEFGTQSELVGETQNTATDPEITLFKQAVKGVVNAKDRGKIMIVNVFGQKGVDEENIGEKVDEAFEFISQKPKQESVRMRTKSEEGADHPRLVKVSL
jgi:uncharacterized protein YdcH (DUF465 family)